MKKFEDPIEDVVRGFKDGFRDGCKDDPKDARTVSDDRPTPAEIESIRQTKGIAPAVVFVLWRHLRYPLLSAVIVAVYYWLRSK